MRKAFYLLLISLTSVFVYLCVFAVKRNFFPSSIVLTEGIMLLTAFAPVLIVFLFLLHKKGVLALDASIGVFIIFLLSSLCFNLTVPAIFDRSVTLYLMNSLDNNKAGMTEREIKREFIRVYFGRNYAIRKRLNEQVQNGGVSYDGNLYKITERGSGIIKVARFLSHIYNLDPRIVEKRDNLN